MKLPDNMANLLASSYSIMRPTAPTADMAKKPAVTPAVAAAPKPASPVTQGIQALTGVANTGGRIQSDQQVRGSNQSVGSLNPHTLTNSSDIGNGHYQNWTTPGFKNNIQVWGGRESGAGALDNYLNRGYRPSEAALMLNTVGGYTQNLSGSRLNDVKAALMPGETEANIAQMRAAAANTAEQTKWMGPRAQADIGLVNAHAADVKNTTDINYRTNSIPQPTEQEVRALRRNQIMSPAPWAAQEGLGNPLMYQDENGIYRFRKAQ